MNRGDLWGCAGRDFWESRRMKKTVALFLGMMATGFAETVYFGTGGKDGIFMSEMDMESGKLSEPVLAAETEGANFLAKSPDGKTVYATGKGKVEAFRVKEDGSLELFGGSAAPGNGPCMVSLDATGKVLLLANYSSGNVLSFPIKEDGSIGEVASDHQHEGSSVTNRQKGPHAHSIYAGPDNKFVYAADLGIDKVMIYGLDAEKATLTPAGEASVPPGSGPRHMKLVGDRAYVLNELTLAVSVFSRGDDGMLKILGTYPVLPEGADAEEMTCSEILVSNDGKFVYTANRDLRKGGGRDSLSVLSVEDDGALELVETVPAEVWIPRNINMDGEGRWLLVAGQNSGEIAVFGVDSGTGKLKYTGQKVKVPQAMRVLF